MATHLNAGGIGGILVAVAIGWVIKRVRGTSGAEQAQQQEASDSWRGFKTLIKTGNTDTLATDNETIDPRFAEHYTKHIKPLVEDFEQRRIEALTKVRKRVLYSGGFFLLAVVCGVLLYTPPTTTHTIYDIAGYTAQGTVTHGGGHPLTVIFALLAFGVFIYALWPMLRYKSSIKQEIFSRVFDFYGSQWHYTPKGIGGVDLLGDIGGSEGLSKFWNQLNTRNRVQVKTGFAQRRQEYEPFMEPYMGYGLLPHHDYASTKDLLKGDYKGVKIELLQCTLGDNDSDDGGSSD